MVTRMGGWCLKGVRGGYEGGVWKAIRHEWEEIQSRSYFLLGNGRR